MRIWVLLIIIILFFGCKRNSSQYKIIDENLSYKLLAFDENGKSFKKNDFVRASIKLLLKTDTIYQKYELLPFNTENFILNNLIADLNEGDSVHFKVRSSYLRNQHFNVKLTNDTSVLDGYLKIYEFLTISKNQDFLAKNDPEFIEQKIIKRYISQFNSFNYNNGIYINTAQSGQGISVENGRTVTLKYIAYFLDGIEFDNTFNKNYFEYTFGTPNQVIQGLDIALLGMKNKEKAKIIIPSQLAFGDKGSATGIVPPFTPLLYEIEIIDIN